MRTRSVIFDTDLGTDVDDALALAVLFGEPSVDLRAVTTVYGDTLLRARLASRYARLAGREVRAYAGTGPTLSGREVWWAGHEGTLHERLEEEPVAPGDAVDVLIETVLANPGEIDVVAVGPLTNIAAAIERHGDFAGAVRHLWLMGGGFASDEPEHNFRSDVTATQRVLGARIPTTIATLDATRRVQLRAEQIDEIAGSGPLGTALQRDIHQWWAFWNETWNVPHDPVTVLALTRPELFTLSAPGNVTVSASGVSTFVPDAAGTTRWIVELEEGAVARAIVDGVVAAQG
ncbi:nucleoside hydrolase [Microbacterium sp. cx-55]|uniref:nucleoside hydrolase n=1 Tax=Microbacterium sp. cx-55 TaxID=2875948 RepID=UPI001CBFA107|nr:nucleoside hydrolase [Microbacterium sp. cx-55]MBZ4488050.1 nucleoside hydrolase [Microbacterium sp. cx-55]UGB34544.1 nucleoside hydrolase [Microbacterium sp. cx-55]